MENRRRSFKSTECSRTRAWRPARRQDTWACSVRSTSPRLRGGQLRQPLDAVAEETTGFGHSRSPSIFRYISSTSGGGGLSLPFSHITMLGWLLRRYIWSRKEAFAISKSSSFQLPQCSQKSQQHHPAIT